MCFFVDKCFKDVVVVELGDEDQVEEGNQYFDLVSYGYWMKENYVIVLYVEYQFLEGFKEQVGFEVEIVFC